MAKYIAKLVSGEEVAARNLFELQTTLCQRLSISDNILTYSLLRKAALGQIKDRGLLILKSLNISSVGKAYKKM